MLCEEQIGEGETGSVFMKTNQQLHRLNLQLGESGSLHETIFQDSLQKSHWATKDDYFCQFFKAESLKHH